MRPLALAAAALAVAASAFAGQVIEVDGQRIKLDRKLPADPLIEVLSLKFAIGTTSEGKRVTVICGRIVCNVPNTAASMAELRLHVWDTYTELYQPGNATWSTLLTLRDVPHDGTVHKFYAVAPQVFASPFQYALHVYSVLGGKRAPKD